MQDNHCKTGTKRTGDNDVSIAYHPPLSQMEINIQTNKKFIQYLKEEYFTLFPKVNLL
jgi:hypothetical protein